MNFGISLNSCDVVILKMKPASQLRHKPNQSLDAKESGSTSLAGPLLPFIIDRVPPELPMRATGTRYGEQET